MDLLHWVEEAESILRMDGLWPEQDEERARGVLEEAALRGPAAVTQAIYALRRELREREMRMRNIAHRCRNRRHSRATSAEETGQESTLRAMPAWFFERSRLSTPSVD